MDSKFFITLEILFKILKISGMWIDKSATKANFIFGLLMHLFGIDLYLLFQLLYISEITTVLEFSDHFGIMFIYVLIWFRSFFIMFRTQEIIALKIELEELIAFCENTKIPLRSKLQARTDQILKVLKNCLILMVFICAMETLGLMLNVINGPPYILRPILWFPFDYENSLFCFGCLGTYQVASVALYGSVNLANDIMPSFFFNTTAGLLEELNDRIEMLKENGNMRELEKCIEIHIKIRNFVTNAEKFYSPIFFIHGLLLLIILCTTAFSLSTVSFSLVFFGIKKFYFHFHRFQLRRTL